MIRALKIVNSTGSRWVNYIFNLFMMKIRNVVFSEDIVINGKIFIRGKGDIFLGKGVVINSSFESNPIGKGSRTSLVVAEGASISVGDGSGLSNVSIYSRECVRIGENVYIGGGVCIYDTDFHSLELEKRLMSHDHGECRSVEINNGAFIGAGSIILKGVSIGARSVIGAGSVVTRNVPDNEVWAGNPAKKIRQLNID